MFDPKQHDARVEDLKARYRAGELPEDELETALRELAFERVAAKAEAAEDERKAVVELARSVEVLFGPDWSRVALFLGAIWQSIREAEARK